tara:strand:+ start:857 stop:1078 length:222 start_codon:yes stop_codon:yes gene_type:complete
MAKKTQRCKPCKKPTKKSSCKKSSGKKGSGKKRTGKKRKSNPWLDHIKKVRAANKNLSFKEVLKLAAKNYKKV